MAPLKIGISLELGCNNGLDLDQDAEVGLTYNAAFLQYNGITLIYTP